VATLADEPDAVGAVRGGAMATTVDTRIRVGSEEYSEVLEFLYDELDLLDNFRFPEWLELLATDIEYRMPVRLERMPKDGHGFVTGMEFFSETFASLTTRVKRLQTEQAWAEQPNSRTRHLLANVRIDRAERPDELTVVSNFIVTRTHWDFPYDLFAGERHDVLRRANDSFKVARRTIYLDQTVLHSYNLSIFF
jgi:3-phenylpropionate/cinnamic acid dioxygenase small subunit